MATATTSNLTFLLPSTLPIRFSLPTRLLRAPHAPPRRLRTAAVSRTLTPPVSPEIPEAAEELRLETESALEWGGVCARLADFAATAAGRAACAEGRVPVGRSREESERLLEQTAAAVALLSSLTPLDFGSVDDVSAAVAAAARGRLLAVREICGVGRSLRAARGVFEEVKRLAEERPDGRYSPLLDILQDCDFLTEPVKMIEFCLDSNLSVVLDRASDKLGTIRKERKMNVDALESLLRDTSTRIFQAGRVDKQKERQGLLYDSLREERNLLESEANEAASVLSDVEGLYNEIRSEADDLDNRVAALRAIESQKVQQELKVVKTEMDLIIKNFEVQLQNSKLEQYNSAMRKAEAATASLAAAHQPTEFTFSDDENKSSYVPQIGDKVYVEGLGGGSTATVVEIISEDGSCIVQYGKIKARTKNNKMKLAQRDMKETSASSVQRKGRTVRAPAEAAQATSISFAPAVQTSKNTVDLRGLRVAEASHELQMAIDGCRSYQVLFVVHGMGTGAVKEVALGILRSHPRVARIEDESPLNYGCTVAYIE